MYDWVEPYWPDPRERWETPVPAGAKWLADAGEHYLIPRGEDDDERLAPISARLAEIIRGGPVEMVRVTLWCVDEPIESKLTAVFWVMRCIASHPRHATHVTLQDLGDWRT